MIMLPLKERIVTRHHLNTSIQNWSLYFQSVTRANSNNILLKYSQIATIRGDPLPKHSHTIQGVVHTHHPRLLGPVSLHRGRLQRALSTPCSYTLTLGELLPPSGLTLSFLQQSLRCPILGNHNDWVVQQKVHLSWMPPESDPKQRNPWIIIYTLMTSAAVPHFLSLPSGDF